MIVTIHLMTLAESRVEVYGSEPAKLFTAIEASKCSVFVPGNGREAAENARKLAGLLVEAATRIDMAIADDAAAQIADMEAACAEVA
jgi:hypothetical protein